MTEIGRTLKEIVDDIRKRHEFMKNGDGVLSMLPPAIEVDITDALAEIDRRLQLVEPCRGAINNPHRWRVRGADGSYLGLGADLTAPGIRTVCDGCGLEWPR